MHLTESDIRYIADLARLHVSDDEAARLSRDLTEIVRFIDASAEDDGPDADPMAGLLGAEGVTREDTVDPSSVGSMEKKAPEAEDGFVVVPPVRGPGRPSESGDGASE